MKTESAEEQLLVKNMVCDRCIMVVRDALQHLGLEVKSVELGKAVIKPNSNRSFQQINDKLKEYGFELIEDQHHQLTEAIKGALIEYVHDLENKEEALPKLSSYVAQKLHQNYSSLSAVFSENEAITIEKYAIRLKIERVKELLSYGALTLSEIAHRLSYSNVAYLSNQFKKVTGMSVTDFKKARDSLRKPLDDIN